jgi:type I restriction enzyme S subunit
MTEIQIKQGWQEVKLGDIAAVTSSKRIFASDYVDNGIPFFRSKEIINLSNGDNIATELFITDQKYAEIKDRFGVPMKGDILITSVGTLGVLYQVNCGDFYFKDGNLIWIKDFKNKTDSKFLLYALKSNKNQEKLKGQAIGSSQKAFTIDLIKNFEITLPPLPIQNKIAEILGNYDDLIEANNRRIKILETQAAKIYTEWFVHYRYPGHESIPLIDSGTGFGMIPQGWEVRKVGDLLEKVKRKKKLLVADYLKSGNYPVVDQGKDFFAGYTDDEETVYDETLIVFGDHTRCFKFCNFDFACGADGTQLVKSNDLEHISQIMLYYLVINADLKNDHYARHFKFLKSLNIVVPVKEPANKFTEIIKPFYEEIKLLNQQNQNLKKSRDLLIPQLVGGLLEV